MILNMKTAIKSIKIHGNSLLNICFFYYLARFHFWEWSNPAAHETITVLTKPSPHWQGPNHTNKPPTTPTRPSQCQSIQGKKHDTISQTTIEPLSEASETPTLREIQNPFWVHWNIIKLQFIWMINLIITYHPYISELDFMVVAHIKATANHSSIYEWTKQIWAQSNFSSSLKVNSSLKDTP